MGREMISSMKSDPPPSIGPVQEIFIVTSRIRGEEICKRIVVTESKMGGLPELKLTVRDRSPLFS
jgi:hypothetical protein